MTLTRWKAFVIVLVIWAGIYLPALGTRELKGEEGRRILPAVAMLETGNWIVPSIGGEDYYNKPPFINWLVALSFMITGDHSEWSARLPSVVCILACVSLLIWMPSSSCFNLPARLMTAIVFLTNVGLIEFGRMIEIEAVYVSLTGIAIFWWLHTWSQSGSKWLVWIVPSIVLGFGMLTKGPIITAFFYCTVILVLWYARRIKDLFTVEHVVGFLIMFVMSVGWAYLAYQQTSGTAMTNRWITEWVIRFAPGNPVTFPEWAEQVGKELFSFLPWLLFLPLLWRKKYISQIKPEHVPVFKGCRLSLVIGFVLINTMWAVRARYVYPLFPVASILVGWMLSLRQTSALRDRIWRDILMGSFLFVCIASVTGLLVITHGYMGFLLTALTMCMTAMIVWKLGRLQGTLRLSLATALLAVVVTLHYAVFGMPIFKNSEKLRPSAAIVNALVPPEDTVYVFRPGSQPLLFYIRPPLKYLLHVEEIGEHVRYLLVKNQLLEELKTYPSISSRSPRVLHSLDPRIRYKLVELKTGPSE